MGQGFEHLILNLVYFKVQFLMAARDENQASRRHLDPDGRGALWGSAQEIVTLISSFQFHPPVMERFYSKLA